MSTRINLWRALFGEKPRILLENSDFTVTSFRYDSGVEGLKIANSRGTFDYSSLDGADDLGCAI